MRFESSYAPAGGRNVALTARTLERPGGAVDVEAPAHWTRAQLDAWLSWAETLPEHRRGATSPFRSRPAMRF